MHSIDSIILCVNSFGNIRYVAISFTSGTLSDDVDFGGSPTAATVTDEKSVLGTMSTSTTTIVTDTLGPEKLALSPTQHTPLLALNVRCVLKGKGMRGIADVMMMSSVLRV